ncbi:MAG: class I SAM-dependent methyltransferase [Nanoarchaeota archaeon]|nr:class I SAM-dependent methyltransferase [Nanoarchaeota archaeon]
MHCKSIEDENKYLSQNPLMKIALRKFSQGVINLSLLCKPKNILDIGCGNGFVTKELAKTFPKAKITAVDIEAEKIAYAKKNNNLSNITYQRRNLFRLGFKKNSFDLVICNEVIEHLQNYKKALEIISSLSSEHIIVSVPNEPFFRIATFLRGKFLRSLGNMPGHIHNWSKDEFVKLLGPYGKLIKVFTPVVWTVALIKKRGL